MIISKLSVSPDVLCALSWDFCDVGHFVEYWNQGHSDVHHVLLLTRLEQLFCSVIVSHRDGYNALLLARARQEFVALTSLRKCAFWLIICPTIMADSQTVLQYHYVQNIPEISGKWRKTPAIRRPFRDMGSPQEMFLLKTCDVIWPFQNFSSLYIF